MKMLEIKELRFLAIENRLTSMHHINNNQMETFEGDYRKAMDEQNIIFILKEAGKKIKHHEFKKEDSLSHFGELYVFTPEELDSFLVNVVKKIAKNYLLLDETRKYRERRNN